MLPEELVKRGFDAELTYTFSRSSGPGGQNVNKVNSRVELRFSVFSTLILTMEEKNTILTRIRNRINTNGEIVLFCQETRSQLENKDLVTQKFYDLLSKALTVPEVRKKTRPTMSSRIKRLEKKRTRGDLKKSRKSGISPGSEE